MGLFETALVKLLPNQIFGKNCKVCKELEKTKKISQILASYLKPFRKTENLKNNIFMTCSISWLHLNNMNV